MLLKVNNKNLNVALNILNHRLVFGLVNIEVERMQRRVNPKKFHVRKWSLYRKLRS